MPDTDDDTQALAGELGESPSVIVLSEGDYSGDQHEFDMKRIKDIEQVFDDPEKIGEAFKSDGVVRCMDGGTEGGLRMAGSGILLPREKLALPKNHPMAAFFQKFGVELIGESEAVLLPNKDYLNILHEKVQQGIIKGISAHTECGAANGDLGRILKSMNIKEEIVAAMVKDSQWQSVVDAHAKLFSETLALELGVDYSWIPLEQMTRKSHKHVEEAFYVNLIGGSRPDVAFNSSKLRNDVPNGFTLHPDLSDPKNTFHRIEISLDIAKVAERFSPQNPFLIVIIDDNKNPRANDEMIAGTTKAVQKFGDRVIIKKVAANLGD